MIRRQLNEPDYQRHVLTWMTLGESYKAIGREDLEEICWQNCSSAYDIERQDEVELEPRDPPRNPGCPSGAMA